MKALRLAIILLFPVTSLYAQNDLLGELNKLDSNTTVPVEATFKSTRIINGHTVETVKKNHMDFRISHRFGRLNSGSYQLYGLDQATLRLGFEYGLTDDLMIGVGRSTEQKAFDFFAKYRLIKQTSGSKVIPVSVTLFASSAIRTLRPLTDEEIPRTFQNKLTYVYQALIAHKFSEKLSLQITPTYLYRNLPELAGEERGLFSLGLGGRLKVSKRVSVNAEYFWTARDNSGLPYHDSMALGVDIDTGGHVFQLHFTNSLGMIEKQFIGETTGSWGKGDIHYGFNISRTFSFDKRSKR
jgi:hypothetical protein